MTVDEPTGRTVDTSVHHVLALMGLAPTRVRAIRAGSEPGNSNWHVWLPDATRAVLRRYHEGAAEPGLAYEYRILRHVASQGWTVPTPLGDPVRLDGRWWGLTRYVPGRSRTEESPLQRSQRGAEMARLDLTLRDLTPELGQRPDNRTAHEGVTPQLGCLWEDGVVRLALKNPLLASWFEMAADETRTGIERIGARNLPLTVIHGDLASWNFHYQGSRLSGVVDFALAHLDSRPYELAMARVYRSPETLDAYRETMSRYGWPLSELEEACIDPIYRAFRVGMAAWALHDGLRDGRFDLAFIESQLAHSGSPRPDA